MLLLFTTILGMTQNKKCVNMSTVIVVCVINGGTSETNEWSYVYEEMCWIICILACVSIFLAGIISIHINYIEDELCCLNSLKASKKIKKFSQEEQTNTIIILVCDFEVEVNFLLFG